MADEIPRPDSPKQPKRRRNPNPQFSVRMGKNAWRALTIATRSGHVDREGWNALRVIECAAENHYRTEHPLRHRADEDLSHQIQQRIEDLQLATNSLAKGVDVDTVRSLLVAASNMLLQTRTG